MKGRFLKKSAVLVVPAMIGGNLPSSSTNAYNPEYLWFGGVLGFGVLFYYFYNKYFKRGETKYTVLEQSDLALQKRNDDVGFDVKIDIKHEEKGEEDVPFLKRVDSKIDNALYIEMNNKERKFTDLEKDKLNKRVKALIDSESVGRFNISVDARRIDIAGREELRSTSSIFTSAYVSYEYDLGTFDGKPCIKLEPVLEGQDFSKIGATGKGYYLVSPFYDGFFYFVNSSCSEITKFDMITGELSTCWLEDKNEGFRDSYYLGNDPRLDYILDPLTCLELIKEKDKDFYNTFLTLAESKYGLKINKVQGESVGRTHSLELAVSA